MKGDVRGRITAYLVKHMGEVVHVDSIAAETGLTRVQIQASINVMIKNGVRIAVEMPANAWRYVGPSPDDVGSVAVVETTSADVVTVIDTRGSLYEEVGRTREGHPLIQNDEGVLFVAKEVTW